MPGFKDKNMATFGGAVTKILNINCIHYKWGVCNLKQRKRFGLFKTNCPEVEGKVCSMKKQHPKPPAPPPPPPKRVIREDVRIWPLTEGKVRGGMSNVTKKTSSRPTHPPPAPKKPINKKEILKKVEKKEFIRRCIAVDICPTCGNMLYKVDNCNKVCNNCNLIFLPVNKGEKL